MEPSQAAQIANELPKNYPTIKWDRRTLEPYVARLLDMPHDVGVFAMAYMCEEVRIPSVADFLQRAEQVKREMADTYDVPTMRVGTGARHDIAEAKLKLVQAKASPADDPAWGDDTPPLRDCTSVSDWLATQATDEQKRTLARWAPRIAYKYGVTLSDDTDPAIARAQAMKREGWS